MLPRPADHPRFRAGPWTKLPSGSRTEIARYVVEGAVMSTLLRAVAAGDLLAITRMRGVGFEVGGIDIGSIAEFFGYMPERCHGSYTRVAEWEMIGGLHGIQHLNEGLGRVYP